MRWKQIKYCNVDAYSYGRSLAFMKSTLSKIRTNMELLIAETVARMLRKNLYCDVIGALPSVPVAFTKECGLVTWVCSPCLSKTWRKTFFEANAGRLFIAFPFSRHKILRTRQWRSYLVLFNSIKRDARKVWHSHFFVRPSNERKKDNDENKQFKCGESVHCYNPFVLFLIVGLLVLFFGRWLHWVSGSFYGSYLSF